MELLLACDRLEQRRNKYNKRSKGYHEQYQERTSPNLEAVVTLSSITVLKRLWRTGGVLVYIFCFDLLSPLRLCHVSEESGFNP